MAGGATTTPRCAVVPLPEFGLLTDECLPASERCGCGLAGGAVPVVAVAVLYSAAQHSLGWAKGRLGTAPWGHRRAWVPATDR